MRLRSAILTGETGVGYALFEHVTGFLESIQYVEDADIPYGSNVNVGVFLTTEYNTISEHPLYFKDNFSAAFLALPRRLSQKNIDGSDTTEYERIYLSDDSLLVSVDDSADNASGGTSGVFILRVSQPEPVRR
jgi:hypothetical protein